MMGAQENTQGTFRGEDGLPRPAWALSNERMQNYYDTEWGMPLHDEQALFERLSLEAFQSGLSWDTILAKRPAFREAFADFDPEVVARFGEAEITELMDNPGIVRNRRKIEATINNAHAVLDLRSNPDYPGGLSQVIWGHKPEQNYYPEVLSDVPTTSPESVHLAKTLKKLGFNFVGPTTMFALMEAIGVVDTHLMSSFRRATSGVWDNENPPV